MDIDPQDLLIGEAARIFQETGEIVRDYRTQTVMFLLGNNELRSHRIQDDGFLGGLNSSVWNNLWITIGQDPPSTVISSNGTYNSAGVVLWATGSNPGVTGNVIGLGFRFLLNKNDLINIRNLTGGTIVVSLLVATWLET